MNTRMSQMMKRAAELAGVALLACLSASTAFAQLDPGSRSMMQQNNRQSGEPANRPHQLLDLTDLLGLHRQHLTSPDPEAEVLDPVKLGLAKAKVYKFSTADYPGGDLSVIVDTNASTAVGYFKFSSSSNTQAFTLESPA